MATVEETLGAKTPLGAALEAGVDNISLNQEITFVPYIRLVLPADGYVFWVKANFVSQSALLNVMGLNTSQLNQSAGIPASEVTVQGSFHYETVQQQEEDATFSVNRVVFTALRPIVNLNLVDPNILYIGTFEGVRFAFSMRASYYQQAALHHYVGNAIYSMLESQIIDDPRLLNARQLIVSNSLPAWLALNQYSPVYPVPLPHPKILLFPSFLAPNNMPPVYGTVHIEPDSTEGLAAAPTLSSTLTHRQLAKERVTVTLYGVNNDLAMTFLDSILQYQLDVNSFGITNIPIVRDDKRTQVELSAIAQKKRIIFEVNYYQSSVRNVARQLIESCITTIHAEDNPLPITSAPIVPIIR